MSLVTRCPRCATLFRVTPPQLQARGGQVRCGRCMHVFDGFQALAGEQANASSAPVQAVGEGSSAGAAAPAAAATVRAAAPVGPSLESKRGAAVESERKSAAPSEPQRAASSAGKEGAARAAAAVAPRAMRGPGPAALSAGCIVAALVLGLQVAYAYRSELGARYPGVRSLVSSACDALGCSVALPHNPDLVKIEASDVHRVDASRPELVQLTATLRSYAGYYLAYPALDLVLTNANEHALARRIFVPGEYLRHSRDARAGIAPNAEITIALDLDTGDLNAAGFRLDLLPAPQP